MIHGKLDLVVPYEWAVEAQKNIPDAKLITLDSTGHSPITDDPELFCKTLFDSLR
jgi:proline iminopeptidase